MGWLAQHLLGSCGLAVITEVHSLCCNLNISSFIALMAAELSGIDPIWSLWGIERGTTMNLTTYVQPLQWVCGYVLVQV